MHLASELLQHPAARHGGMDEAQDFPPDCPPDRFWLIYENICRYCDRMWANIVAVRSRAMEHIIFTASILGLYLGFDAASEYKIGWWGFAGIACLLAFTLPHILIAVSITDVGEFRLSPMHAGRPKGETESKTLEALDEIAELLADKAMEIYVRYIFARNYFWRIGVPLAIALGMLEWLL